MTSNNVLLTSGQLELLGKFYVEMNNTINIVAERLIAVSHKFIFFIFSFSQPSTFRNTVPRLPLVLPCPRRLPMHCIPICAVKRSFLRF